ncbi:MAG: tRNA-dihydrouridine synthase family protein [Proteobacteria bacterium]|nr:tRNA-dihydrouridine synthase family protein [Pseudomonadota bacterium]
MVSPIACLAPMDGITDRAYRQIVRKLNPEVVLYSEFTSIDGIEHSEAVRKRLTFDPAELPYFVQIFGNEPDLFTKTVKELQNTGITGIDINMGCPSKRIVKSNTGGSLMKDRDLACRIVEACCKATSLPVTVKTRLGWANSEQLIDFVGALVEAGIGMVTVHGRTYKQAFKGVASWEEIHALKEAVSIPVIGNGDLKGKDDALARLKNLDGYMIGRASIGNPWVFWPDEERETVSLKDKISVMLEHFQLLRSYKDEKISLIEFRKHVSGYISGFRDAKSFRLMLMQSKSEKEFTEKALSIG